MNQFRCANPHKSEHTKVEEGCPLNDHLFHFLMVCSPTLSFWISEQSVQSGLTLLINLCFVLQKVMSQIKMDFDSELKFNSFSFSAPPCSNKVRAACLRREVFSRGDKVEGLILTHVT